MGLPPAPPITAELDAVLGALRAAGEATRLRILVALDDGELTVSELCRILGQSQPRVSRHLRLLCEAGLLERHSEGTSAYYGHARTEPGPTMVTSLLSLVDSGDATLEADRQHRAAISSDRASAATHYFEQIAWRWDQIRSLHVDDADVEAAVLAVADEAAGPRPLGRLLDIGTGTGRILELFASRIEQGLGIDLSSNMLKVARANLAARGLHHCSVRQANVYSLDVAAGSIDLAIAHHVLHFLDDPAAALTETAETLRPGGQLIVVDFAPHRLDGLRVEHAHRWLGFDSGQIEAWCHQAELDNVTVRHLTNSQPALQPDERSAEPSRLTVSLWSARRPSPTRPYPTDPPYAADVRSSAPEAKS